MTLVGVGGGVAALIKFAAERMELNYKIPENAEVISSIGVALAAVQDVVERIVPNPTKQDIQAIKQEVTDMAIESGATEDSVEVHIEIDPQTQKLPPGLRVQQRHRRRKSNQLPLRQRHARLLYRIFVCRLKRFNCLILPIILRLWRQFQKGNGVRVIDKKGFIRVQREHAEVVKRLFKITLNR